MFIIIILVVEIVRTQPLCATRMPIATSSKKRMGMNVDVRTDIKLMGTRMTTSKTQYVLTTVWTRKPKLIIVKTKAHA